MTLTPASVAALATALRADRLPDWLSAVERAGVSRAGREVLARVIEHDRRLWSQHPNSIASGLLARTERVPGLEALHASWREEAQTAGRPWIRCVEPLTLPAGLLATLSPGDGLDLWGLDRVQFPANDMVTLESIRYHPPAPPRRPERLHWSWRTGSVRFEPDPDPVVDAPCFEQTATGAVQMRAGPGAAPITLPCPPGSSAYAQVGVRRGSTIVYGRLDDEGSGGFVWFVRERGGFLTRRRFEVERKLELSWPVWSVHESADGEVVLARTSLGVECWGRDGTQRTLPIRGDSVALSPDGERVASLHAGVVRVWSVRETSGSLSSTCFPATFSPGGARLLRGTTLYDGASGRPVAELDATFGQYMEGGPPDAWCHVGDELVVNVHSGPQVWRAADGAPLELTGRLRFAHWHTIAFDHAGRHVAALTMGQPEVILRTLPSAEVVAEVTFELERADRLALAPGADRVAIGYGPAIEVRTRAGELVRRFRHPVPDDQAPAPARRRAASTPAARLRFVDDDHLVSHADGDGWRVFRFHDGTSDPCGAPEARPAEGWKITPSAGHTVFEHAPSATRIALPVSGPWAVHPTRPTLLACADGMVELR